MSKTPRTDALLSINEYPEYHAVAKCYVDADFARELELENAELLLTLTRLYRICVGHYGVFDPASMTVAISKTRDIIEKHKANKKI